MKPKLLFVLLIFLVTGYHAAAEKITKAELVFKGIQNTGGNWQLCFEDKKGKPVCFNATRSNTEPYILYTTATDGSLRENEKVKGLWFLVSYTVWVNGKLPEKIVTKLDLVKQK